MVFKNVCILVQASALEGLKDMYGCTVTQNRSIRFKSSSDSTSISDLLKRLQYDRLTAENTSHFSYALFFAKVRITLDE